VGKDDPNNATSQAWTVLTLKELLEARIDALDKRISVQAIADERALKLAESNVDERLKKLNELRDIVAANDSRYMPRETAEARLSRLESALSKATGALVLVAIVGASNFFKIWLG
jgi:uncharacterized membrane protein YjjP (DUF1212 family)